jgi:beta-lactamase class A
LKYQIAYDKEIIEDKTVRQNIVPDSKLELDKSYSIEELIRRMIVYSDNASKGLLLNNISEDVLNKVYTDLGIIIPDIRGKEDFLTTKEYSSFFRVLFNASYLNKDMSEKALGILSQTAFKMGIVRGVPSNIVVAHKFAERGNLSNQTVQLHDCGIVYYKEKPYLLCVMTYDRDFQELEAVIKEISEIAYKKIDSSYKKYK